MIYDYDINMIVMLNNLDENGIGFDEWYFPKENKILKIGDFEIKNLGEIWDDF